MGHLPWREDGSVFFTWPSTGVFFTWPTLDSPLLDPLLESSSFEPLWILLCSTLYWSLLVWVSLGLSYFPVWVSSSASRLCPPLSVVCPVWVSTMSTSAWPPQSLSFLCFLCRASPWSMLRILTLPWFSMTVACCLHSYVTKSCKYGILNAMCKSRVSVRHHICFLIIHHRGAILW